VPQGKHLRVHTGDYIDAGDPLTEGPMVPADILRIKGEEALYIYMLDEVQNVYRAQGVVISDKHIESHPSSDAFARCASRQPGDTDFLPNEVVDKFASARERGGSRVKLRIEDPGDTDLPDRRARRPDDVKEKPTRSPRPKARAARKTKKQASPPRARRCSLASPRRRCRARVVPLGRQLPGDHQGAHRSRAAPARPTRCVA
jgi:hypothetical protein